MGNCMSQSSGNTRASPNPSGGNGSFANVGNNLSKASVEVIKKKLGKSNIFFTRDLPTAAYNEQANKTIPAVVRMFSGCKDHQTSADVSDVTSFGIAIPDPSEKSGGACTNSLLHALNNHPTSASPITFGQLLVQMQKTLTERKYTQIPQLSSSHNTFLNDETFSVWNQENKSGRSRALLIGINYFGSDAALNGCINDVHMMKDYLISQGFSSDKGDMQMLTDDGKSDGNPTQAEILRGLKWLTEGAKEGDSLFLHYSGHGTQTKDLDGDEADGMDEAIVPVDYQTNGLIIDDVLFQMCAGVLPKGVNMICLFDCCHSGTIMDLPYIFSATGEATQALQAGEKLQMAVNPGFNMAYAQQLIASIARGVLEQIMQKASDGEKSAGGGGLKGQALKIAQGIIAGGSRNES